MKYLETTGDLITLTLEEKFDVISHGCNCMSQMGAGIAVPMKNTFGCDKFPMEEQDSYIEKLGNIDYEGFTFTGDPNSPIRKSRPNDYYVDDVPLYVVNSYTQFHYGKKYGNPIDYEAIALCMRKINSVFKGKHIGLPKIGAGLAGGDWHRIKRIIQTELKDMDVTVVMYDKEYQPKK